MALLSRLRSLVWILAWFSRGEPIPRISSSLIGRRLPTPSTNGVINLAMKTHGNIAIQQLDNERTREPHSQLTLLHLRESCAFSFYFELATVPMINLGTHVLEEEPSFLSLSKRS